MHCKLLACLTICCVLSLSLAAVGAEPEKPKADAATSQKAKPDKPKPADAKKPEEKAKPADAKKPEAKKPEEKAKPDDKKKAEKPKKPMVVCFTLNGEYAEGPTPIGLFGEMQESLASLIRRMDQAAEDKDVAAVILRIESVALGRGKLDELRAAVGRLRKAGKPVHAQAAGAQGAQYLLAAACDEVIMPPSGTLVVAGVRAEVLFYKGLLDKLGIKADLMQMGKYKGAGEPYSRTKMSPALRESLESLLDDYFGQMVDRIAKDRNLDPAKVKSLIDQGIFTADAAQKAGLIDRVIYADQLIDSLKKKLGADQIKLVTSYKKRKVDTDFSGLGGMVKLMELMLGGKSSARAGKGNKLAVVYAVGMIIPGKSTSDIFGSQAVGSTTIVKALKQADDDEKVKAIVLRVDSPGGSAVASDLIWREIVRIKKPIIASMGDVAGSGGYYISMGADRIFAEPGTLTGSIGVIGGKMVLGGLFDKLGLTTDVISRGKNSGSFSSTQAFTPEERKVLQAVLEDIYRQFVSKAARGRKMPAEKLEKLAQGRVYSGSTAKDIGLIDELGTLADAIAAAKKAAGLKPDEKVELLILPRPKTIFEQMFGDPSAATKLGVLSAEVVDALGEGSLFRLLLAEPVMAVMPCRIDVK